MRTKEELEISSLVQRVKNISESNIKEIERVSAYHEFLKSLGGTYRDMMPLPPETKFVAWYSAETDLAYFFTVDAKKPFKKVNYQSYKLEDILSLNPPDPDFYKIIADNEGRVHRAGYFQEAPTPDTFGHLDGFLRLSADNNSVDIFFSDPYNQRMIKSPEFETHGLFYFSDIPNEIDRAARVHDNFWGTQSEYPFAEPSILEGLYKTARYGQNIELSNSISTDVAIRWKRDQRHMKPVKVFNSGATPHKL